MQGLAWVARIISPNQLSMSAALNSLGIQRIPLDPFAAAAAAAAAAAVLQCSCIGLQWAAVGSQGILRNPKGSIDPGRVSKMDHSGSTQMSGPRMSHSGDPPRINEFLRIPLLLLLLQQLQQQQCCSAAAVGS